METLKEFKHWPVVFLEKTWRDLDSAVGCYADEILIEGAMVDRTQAKSVVDGRFAPRLNVADDVSSVEQCDFP